jgi:uncharacterized protein
MQETLIGTVKGPGENPHEYTFITSDNKSTRIGEFVYYIADTGDDAGKLNIIGTITERTLVRSLPDSFLADPNTPPSLIASLIGLPDSEVELYEITVEAIGYFSEGMGDFINPRIPPMPGQPVFIASNEMLSKMLSPKQQGQVGGAHIGSLLTRKKDEVPIVLSVKDVVSTHLAVLASTGAGKSYTASVLIEELMMPHNRAAVLIVDPHGEYHTLTELHKHPAFKGSDGYAPEVKIFTPDKIKVRISTLTEADINYLLPETTEKMKTFLSQAFIALINSKHGASGHWGFQDLLTEVIALKYGDEKSGGGNTSTIDGLEWRLKRRFEQSRTFSDHEHIELQQMFRPGQCTVLQLSDIEESEQQVIVGTLLRRINKARVSTEREQAHIGEESYLPYPVFVLLEEAHRYAPAGTQVVSTNILKTILSEGRKFGVGIGLITQRPGKLDQDVLSQCMTQFIMRIVNPIDQQTIASSVEGAGRRLLDELPALTKGQVIVSGVAINTPVLCQVRSRITKHGGETIDAPARWEKYFTDSEKKSRERDEAKLVKPKPKDTFTKDGWDL